MGLTRAGRSLLGSIAAVLALMQAAACAEDEEYTIDEDLPLPTGQLEVTVEFPSEQSRTATAAVQLWVLTPEASGGATCALLIGGAIEPDDAAVTQRADLAVMDPTVTLTRNAVAEGAALVYIEAVDFYGDVVLAACTEADIVEDETRQVTLTLETARVYDCADEDTDGAPCDDGLFCTVGETCLDGECQGAEDRRCSHLSFDCQRGVCDEELGCTTVQADPGESCDDGRFCTVGDACDEEGRCQGTPRDCTQTPDQCTAGGTCDESLDMCTGSFVDPGTDCDDGLGCTESDHCDGAGSCIGSPMDCSVYDMDSCNIGVCVEPGTCVTQHAELGSPCDDGDPCTLGDECDGAGSCVPLAANPCDGVCHTGVCDPVLGCVLRPAGSLCGLRNDCLQTCDAAGTCAAVPAAAGANCDDLNECTTLDACDALGVCAGTPVPEASATPCGGGLGTCVGGLCVMP